MTEAIISSSGNVFADLGFSGAETTILTMRAELMAQCRILIEQQNWTQQQAADVLNVTQARVSDLIRGKTEKFSLDMLVLLLLRAGGHCELKLAA